MYIALFFIHYTLIIHIQCIEKAFFMRLCSQYAYLSIQICRLPLFAFLSYKYMQAQARTHTRVYARARIAAAKIIYKKIYYFGGLTNDTITVILCYEKTMFSHGAMRYIAPRAAAGCAPRRLHRAYPYTARGSLKALQVPLSAPMRTARVSTLK